MRKRVQSIALSTVNILLTYFVYWISIHSVVDESGGLAANFPYLTELDTCMMNLSYIVVCQVFHSIVFTDELKKLILW